MINFQSKITKSIIIAIFILSLTISIYIVPASAIVTGSLSSVDISPMFSLDNYNYCFVHSSIYSDSTATTLVRTQNFFGERSKYLDTKLYLVPFTSDKAYLPFYSRDYPFTYNSDFEFNYSGAQLPDSTEYRFDDYIRFQVPLGIRDSEKITIQFLILVPNSYKDILENVEKNSLTRRLVKFYAVDGEGVGRNISSSVYEYQGLAEYSTGSGDVVSYYAKVYDVELTGYDLLNYIYVDFNPQKDILYGELSYCHFGITKIFYEGANTQLTNIQDSINGLISGIENQGSILDEMTKQQAEFYENMLQLSPAGQQIIQDVQDNFSEGEQGLDDLIQGITVDKPEPDELLPDHEVVLGRYMDRGGSEALGAVITPLFDETGPIYIMLFAVLSIALISYVLYGKKA